MHLKNLHLTQFKNLKKVQIEFSPEINCLMGYNGSGKTNLLDAIHYLCLTKSAFNAVDVQNILHGSDFFTLKGNFQYGEKVMEVKCILEPGKKKQFINNGKAYTKMSEHIGMLPVVFIAPDDTQLIKGGSEERRKFFDSILSQLDQNYLEKLIRYQHFLKQRNALIKNFSESNRLDHMLLEPYDKELIQLSLWIGAKRAKFIKTYVSLLIQNYAAISEKKEEAHITYISDCLSGAFEEKFKSSLKKDLLLKRTNTGIHRDEFSFETDGHPLKKFGSQGQQKSFLIALKLAQFHVFKTTKQTKPILLLDDIFDKLDDLRIKKMMELVAHKEFGQLFITDARPERSKKILSGITSDIRYFEVEGGDIYTS
jgi:DNA replication and repair protein RecF